MTPAASRPTVGVVITAYRRTEFLGRALASIAGGRELPDFVLVVEENPPYEAGASALLDQALPTVPHADVNRPLGQFGELIATGLKRCPTDVVAFLEDDDLFLPEKVAHLRAFFGEHPELGYLRHPFQAVDDDLVPIPMRRHTVRVPAGPVAPEPRAWARTRIAGNCSSIALRRQPVLPYVPAVRDLSAALDRALFWLALRADLVPYCEPRVLTRKAIHFDSSSWKPFIYARQRTSLEALRSRSRAAGAEAAFAEYMMGRLPPVRSGEPTAPKPRAAGFRLLARLQERLPPRPAAWVRRASLTLALAFTW